MASLKRKKSAQKSLGAKKKKRAGTRSSKRAAKVKSTDTVDDSGDDAAPAARARARADLPASEEHESAADPAPDLPDLPAPPAVPPPPDVAASVKQEARAEATFGGRSVKHAKAMATSKAAVPSKEYLKRATREAGLSRRSKFVYPHISKALAMHVDEVLRTAVILADHEHDSASAGCSCKVDARHVSLAAQRHNIAIVGGEGVLTVHKSIKPSLVINRFNQLDAVRYRDGRTYRITKRAVTQVQLAAEVYFARFNIHQKMGMKFVARRSTNLDRDVVAAGVAAGNLYQLAQNMFAPENEFRAETYERAAKNMQAARNKKAGRSARGRQTTFGRHEMLGVHYCCFDPTCSEGCVDDNAATRGLMAGVFDAGRAVAFESMRGTIYSASKQRLTAVVSWSGMPDANFDVDGHPGDAVVWAKALSAKALEMEPCPSNDFVENLMQATGCTNRATCEAAVNKLVAKRKLARRAGRTHVVPDEPWKPNAALARWLLDTLAAKVTTRADIEAAAEHTQAQKRAELVSELGPLSPAHLRHLMGMSAADLEAHVARLRGVPDLALKEPMALDFAAELDLLVVYGHIVEHPSGVLTPLLMPLSNLTPVDASGSVIKSATWTLSGTQRAIGKRSAVSLAAKSLVESDSRCYYAQHKRGSKLFELVHIPQRVARDYSSRSAAKRAAAEARKADDALVRALSGKFDPDNDTGTLMALRETGVVALAEEGARLDADKWLVVDGVRIESREVGILREHFDDVEGYTGTSSTREHAGFVEDPMYVPSDDDTESDDDEFYDDEFYDDEFEANPDACLASDSATVDAGRATSDAELTDALNGTALGACVVPLDMSPRLDAYESGSPNIEALLNTTDFDIDTCAE